MADDDELIEPCTADTLRDRVAWSPRLRSATGAGWSAATVLRASAPLRRSGGALLLEPELGALVALVPEPSLNPGPGSLADRLSGLHDRLAPADAGRTRAGMQPYPIAGRTGTLERFVGDRVATSLSCCLSAEAAPGVGVVGVAWGPAQRVEALEQVAIPVLASARLAGDVLEWSVPLQWTRREEVQLTTPHLRATAELELLSAGAAFDDWVELVFERAPYLRDMRTATHRAVSVDGADRAELWRFDWQPSGRGRLLTTVVAGVAGTDGFCFTFEVPFEGSGEFLLIDPDTVLGAFSIAEPAISMAGPAPLPPPPDPLPSPGAAAAAALADVHVGIDRLLRALVDHVDGERSAASSPAPDWALAAAERLEATHGDPARRLDDVYRLDEWRRAALATLTHGRRPPVHLRPPFAAPPWFGSMAVRLVDADEALQAMEAEEGSDSWRPGDAPPPPGPPPDPGAALPTSVPLSVMPLAELVDRAEHLVGRECHPSPEWIQVSYDLEHHAVAALLGNDEASFTDVALAVASLVVAAFDDARSAGRGAVDVIAQLSDHGLRWEDRTDPWGVHREGLEIHRPLTYVLEFSISPGGPALVPSNEAARRRWGGRIDLRDLLIPSTLVARFESLGAAWHELLRADDPAGPTGPGGAVMAFLREHAQEQADLQRDLLAVLGSAYVFD